MDPKNSEYASLDAWLRFLHSDAGVKNAGGGITQYLLPEELDEADLDELVRDTAQTFRPLMKTIDAGNPQPAAIPTGTPEPRPPLDGNSVADSLKRFLSEFSLARIQPFQKVESLWKAMDDLKGRIEDLPAVLSRPDLLVSISVGQGNWAGVPLLAVMNTKVTRSTQEGIYVVLLIAKNLRRVFLTLNQGTTKLVQELGQTGAQARMISVAESIRTQIPDLAHAGFALDNEIELDATGWLAKNYEIGTIAHAERARSSENGLSGMLLYPDVGRTLRLRYRLLGVPVLVSTVDLGNEWQAIEAELHAVLDECATAAISPARTSMHREAQTASGPIVSLG